MLDDVGLIAANTSRTRAYLFALKRNNLLPAWTLLLDEQSSEIPPGQSTVFSGLPPSEKAKMFDNWSEADFNPTIPLARLFDLFKLEYVYSASRDINSIEVIKLIEASPTSVLIYSGYGGSLLRSQVLSTGKRFLHVHGGYLPDYKGSTTNYYSILSEKCLGASSIFLTKDIDSGPILMRKKFPLPPNMYDIDHRYDSAVRAKVLVQTLQEYQQHGYWPNEDADSIRTSPYYIIHPTLKHLSILGNSVHSSLL